MGKKSDSVKLSAWRGRQEVAKSRFEKNKPKILRRLKFYNGDHWDNTATTYDQLTINYIATIVDILRDSVYYKNPQFRFKGSPLTAPLMNKVFPDLLRRTKYKFQTKKCLFEALNVGFAYKLHGYHSQGLRTNDAVQSDEIFGTWVKYDKVWIDPDADGLWNANYVMMSKYESLDYVKNNPNFTVPKDLQGGYIPDNESLTRGQLDDLSRVELIHVFDRGEGKYKIFIPDVSNWVYEGEWPLGQTNLFPINMLRMNEDDLYPVAPTEKLIPLNQQINKMESMKMTHAKRFNRKYHVKGDIGEGRAALVSGIDGAIVETDPDVEIVPITDADINPAVYGTAESAFFFMKLLARVGEYQSGTVPKGETTATEANYVAAGSSLAITNVQDILADFCEQDAQIMMALMRENYDTERRIYDDDNNIYIGYDKSDLQQAVEVGVDVVAAAPPDQVQEQQEALAVYNLLAQSPFVDLGYITRKVIEAFPTIGDPNRAMLTEGTLQKVQSTLKLLQGGGLPAVGAGTGENQELTAAKYGEQG